MTLHDALTSRSDAVRAEMAVLLEVPIGLLTADCPLADVVPDSFVLVELAVELGATFDVEVGPADLERIRTVGDVVAAFCDRAADVT